MDDEGKRKGRENILLLDVITCTKISCQAPSVFMPKGHIIMHMHNVMTMITELRRLTSTKKQVGLTLNRGRCTTAVVMTDA